MPVELILAGVPLVLAQTTAYALPVHVVHLQATDAIEASVVSETTGYTLVAASTTGVTMAAAFVRCTTSTTCVVLVKRFI